MSFVALRRTNIDAMNWEQSLALPFLPDGIILGEPRICHLLPTRSVWLLWENEAITPNDVNLLIALTQNKTAFRNDQAHRDPAFARDWLRSRAMRFDENAMDAWQELRKAWGSTINGLAMFGWMAPAELVEVNEDTQGGRH